VLHHHLVGFFHEEGNGLPIEQMKALEDFNTLETELKMRCASTEDLMRLFYMQVRKIYEEALCRLRKIKTLVI